ncbi:YpiB family protein [Halalkalibacterium ligniniphilum]|uniref:YpiB family protein n=1 Tax=Halalkalibacterium ligniniphilum TaxID=1134413 RepID=UPI0003465D48|nr:YpiB family protein [Halalkalibacterium ligniniphilum]
MRKWISVAEKRQFLQWFLNSQQLKRKEARQVLEHMIKRHHILENVSFTEEIKLSETTMVISSMNSDEPGFVFYSQQRKTDDVARALGELMANPSKKVNLILHFYGKSLNHQYLQLLDAPAKERVMRYKQFQHYAKETDQLIESIILETEKEALRQQIDEALDQKDEARFKRLVAELNELEAK